MPPLAAAGRALCLLLLPARCSPLTLSGSSLLLRLCRWVILVLPQVSCAPRAGDEPSRPMLPRAIGRLPTVGIRSRPLSTHKTYYYWGSTSAASQGDISVPHTCSTNVHACSKQQPTASCRTAPAGFKEERRHQWRERRQFSTGRRAVATAAPSPEVAGEEMDKQADGRDNPEEALGIEIDSGGTIDDNDDESLARVSHTPPAAGLRPETAPASTPLDLGCKAYYMARNIGIKTVCTVRHAGFRTPCLTLLSCRLSVIVNDEQDTRVVSFVLCFGRVRRFTRLCAPGRMLCAITYRLQRSLRRWLVLPNLVFVCWCEV